MQAHELQGVLKKRSRRGIWQTRFFSTRGQYLQYARDSKSLVRKEINLSTFTHIFATTNQISFCCEGASWVLKAKSCEQADEWTKFLVQRHRDVLNDALEKNSYDLDAEGTVFCGNNEKMRDQDVTSKRREDDASRTNIVFALGDDEDDSSGEEDEEDPRRRASTDDEDPRSVEKLHSRRLHVVVVPSSNVTSSEKFQASPTNSSCRVSVSINSFLSLHTTFFCADIVVR